jgi:hypothetical protein
VRPTLLCLTLLATVACENATSTLTGLGGAGGGAITQTQATGNWSFTVRKTTTLPCSSGSLADNHVLTAHLNFLADGTLTSSTWQNPPNTSALSVTGTVRLSDGSTDLILGGGTGTTTRMELRGTMTATSTFTGTLTDPAPGFSPMFSVGGCEYSTSGTKA